MRTKNERPNITNAGASLSSGDGDRDMETVMGRRRFCLMAAGTAMSFSTSAKPQTVSGTNAALSAARTTDITIAGVGATLQTFTVDNLTHALSTRHLLAIPAAVQYAWRHPRMPLLYVAFSDGSPTRAGDRHGIATIHLQYDGSMSIAFDSVTLHSRPIHITVAPDGRHLLVAYNKPSAVTVHPLTPHGRPGDAIVQREKIDAGVYAHQVRLTPDGSSVLLVTRGNDSKPGQAEDPGAIRQLTFDAGQLSAEHVVAPNGGYGFGPRHVDFHPHRPWVYVSIERQNQLMMFEMRKGRLADAPSFTVATVHDPDHIRPRQMPAAIHVSRDGRYVYVSNRADHTVRADGTEVFDGGENSIAVFSIDPMTGRPQLVQSADTESFNPRTFSLTSDGKRLISASIEPMTVRTGSGTETVPAKLTLFDVEKTGRLMFRNKTAVETNGDWMFWSGTMSITA